MPSSVYHRVVEPLIAATESALVDLFDLDGCWFEGFPFDVQMPRLERGSVLLPETEPGLVPWSLDSGIELPVRFRGLTVGRFVLVPRQPTTGVAFSIEARAAAIALAAPIGAIVAAELVGADSR
jgi:hypothetical protein